MDIMTLRRLSGLGEFRTNSNSLASYCQEVNLLITLSGQTSLEQNVSKTKELCCYQRV